MASPRLNKLLSDLVKKSRPQLRRRQARASWLEKLEDRHLMAVASPPVQTLPVADQPIGVASGLIDNDPLIDTVTLSRTGQLSIARNAGNGSWRSVNTINPGVGDSGLGLAYGLVGSSLNADAYLDLIAIGQSSARLLFGDGAGGFRLGPLLNAPTNGRFAPTDSQTAVASVGLLNNDLWPDVVLLDTLQHQVAIYYGTGNETWNAALHVNTGGLNPTSLALGDVVGDQQTDLVIGHRDGTLSFLVASPGVSGSSGWSLDTAATLRNTTAIEALATGDVDEDGDTDVVVSASSSAYVLRRDANLLEQSPIANGNFQRGLTGWNVSASAVAAGATPGQISGLGGAAQLIENSSLLTSLQQTFVVPPNPQSISVNIPAISLEYASGAIPDALEISLLASDNSSLVPTHRSGTTSYFNATGTSSGQPSIRLASGVRYVDNLVTLDISGLVPGTSATLVIDLIGNPPGTSSTATISSVAIAPEAVFSRTFTNTALPGSFTRTGSVKVGDVDGDSRTDIVLADPGSNRVVVFNGTSSGVFAREDLDLTTLGGAPGALDLAVLDQVAGDDMLVVIPERDLLLSPLQSSASLMGRVLPDIDFERDARGNWMRYGTLLDNEFASWGVTVTGPASTSAKPVVIDWSRSVDARTPGSSALGKVLVLADYRDRDHDDRDDEHCYVDAYGNRHEDDNHRWRIRSGTLAFDFQAPVMLDQVGLLGIKHGSHAVLSVYSSSGALLLTRTIQGNSTGAEQVAKLDSRNVARLVVELNGPGAISQLVFNRDIPAGSRIQVSGSSQSNEGASYSLAMASPLVSATEWLVNWGDGSVESFSGDPAMAVHTFADGRSLATVYATARDAAGNVYQANLWSVDVANVPPVLTISGGNTIEAGRTYVLSLAAVDPGRDRLKFWSIEWGDGTRTFVSGHATSAKHTYKLTNAQLKTVTIRATARDEDALGHSGYRSNDLVVTVTPDTSRILPTIDFERAGDGSALRGPIVLTDQLSQIGVTVSSTAPFPRGPMVIDSSRPGTGSRDVGSPNSTYKGPGYGLGGMRGSSGRNSMAHKNLLILASDVRATRPEDFEGGGTLRFDFDDPVRLSEVHLLDMDKSGSFIKLYAADGSLISTHLIPRRGVNSFQEVSLNASHVSRMDIELKGGGAIAAIVSRRGAPPIARPESRFFVVDANDLVYRYSAPGSDLGDFSLPARSQPRGIASDVDSNPLWIISEEGSSDRVLVVDSATEKSLGSWTPRGIVQPEGIATDGTHIWILDSSTRKISYFAGAAARRSGSISPTSSFALHANNSRPVDMVTNGTWLWVVDSGTDRVYQYDRQGQLNHSWALDPVNTDPSGIAIQPNQPDGIYVLDSVDRQVYLYPRRSWTAPTAQPSNGNFPLSPGNLQPVGIADPGGQLAVGAVVNETLNATETTTWTFDANAGQSLYINFQSLTEALTWDLLAPNGTPILSKSDFRASGLDSGTLRMDTTGTYSLVLTAGPAATTYRFQIFDIPGPDIQPVTLDQTMIGVLNSPGRPDHWTFTGTSGSTYYLNFLSIDTVVGGDLIVEATSPSGQVISTRTATRESSLDQSFTLTETGTWTIVMRAVFDGSHLPSYSFQLTAVPPDDVTSIAFRQTAVGAIQVAGARDRWLFNANAGQEIFLDMQSLVGGDTRVQIIDPQGVTIADRTFSLASGLDQQLTLDSTGQFTIIVDGGGSANLIDYRLVVWDIPPTITQTTLINTTLAGQTVPGQVVRYEFEGVQGTPILLDVIESSDQSLGVTLIAPDGSMLADRATSDLLLTLPLTGRYQATISRSSPFFLDAYGPYAFRIQDRSSPVTGTLDNLGTRFFVAFPMNLREPFGANNPVFSLAITAPVDTSGTVQVPGLNYSTSYVVRAGQATRIELPSQVELMDSDVIANKGILVTALNEVAVYGLNRMRESTDGFTALPVDAIGTDYYVLGYANTINYVIGGGTNLTVAATEDNTTVTITPKVAVGSRLADQPFTITLNQGQAYTLHTSLPFLADLSGSRVTSDKPISLFGGNTAARVPVNVPAADHLIEQLAPTNTWGSRFATIPLATRTGGDTLRVLAQTNGTQVRINGTLVATLAAGSFYEAIQTTSSLIESSAPVLVAQYSNGSAQDGVPSDPFMMLIPPSEQYLSDYTLTTPLDGININYANLIVPTTAVSSVRMDGAPISAQFTAIGNSGLSGASLPISVGSHRFQANQPFGLAIYGFADFDSYGYFGGMSFGRVAAVTTLTLSPSNAQLPVGTLHTVTAAVTDANGQPLSNVRVDFTIEGLSRETRTVVTDANGRATLQLTRTAVGNDRITAVAGGRTQVATVQWVAGAPQITVTSPAPGGQVLVGPRLLTGSVTAGGAGATIVEVTVNGIRAAALDSSGNFFAPIEVALGSQNFTVSATNSAGLQVSTTVTVTGVANSAGQLTLNNTADITNNASILWTSTSYNRAIERLLVDMQLVNSGTTPIDATVAARFDEITPARVTLVDADATLPTGGAAGSRPAMLFDSEIGSEGLLPNQRSQPLQVAFSVAEQDRLEVDVTLLARSNRAPRFVSIPDLQAVVGQTYQAQVQAVDPDGSRLTYALLAAPAGMTVDGSNGAVSWPVQTGQLGSHQVIVQASDGRGGTATQRFTLVATLAPSNRPPLITSAPITTTTPGSNYQYQVNARDPDNQSLQFTLVRGPVGMIIDGSTGLVRYDNAVAGSYDVQLNVEDGTGGVATQLFRLSVGTGANTGAPRILSSPPTTATVGSLLVYSVSAIDAAQSPLTYVLVNQPATMQIDSLTGRITWRPEASDVGVQVVRVEVRNALGGVAAQTWSLTVSTAAPNLPPVFTSQPVLVATASSPYVYPSMAIDSDTPLQYALVTAPTGMNINRSSGRIVWTPSSAQVGNHLVLVAATDALGVRSFQQYQLSVRSSNAAPQFTSTPLTSATVGTAYRYNALAVDTEDEVTYSLTTAPSGMLIDTRSGAITYQPTPAQIGNQVVTVQALDARGLSTTQTFTLIVSDDRLAPTVSVSLSRNNILPGESIRIQVVALDNSGLASVTLSIDGQVQTLDASRGLNYTAIRPGIPVITATATDIRGNSSTAQADPPLRVIDPNDLQEPLISIDSPTPGQVITYLSDVMGSVTDENLEFYRLEVSPVGQNQWRTIFARSFSAAPGIDGVVSGLLGTLDPTLLANDIYELRVSAQDFSGNQSSRTLEWAIEAGAKLGNYQFTASQNYCGCGAQFVDLEIPLAGIPIRITRSYDTLDAPYQGDFGYGWTMEVANPRINESVRVSPSEAAGGGSLVANPFRVGTRVYLNAPDGRRVAFTFDPVPTAGLLGAVWTPRFVADPGVEMQLEVDPVTLSQQSDGTFSVYLFGLPYNPDTYTLITRDQVRYTYNQFADMQLQSITNRNNVQLSFDDSGIRSSTGPAILWERDSQGRITSIIDPAGNRLQYRYDALGDLVEFENQIGDVTRMRYLTEPAHYLESVIDPRGQQVLLVRYDADGRVSGIGDALGNSTGQRYDLANNREVVADREGNETIIEFDDRGNITRVTDSQGSTVTTEYDTRDRATRVTDPRGFVTQISYDENSNPTQVIDAAGQVWTATYDQFNELLTRTNPLGQVNSFEYDDRGNMIRSVDTNGAVMTVSYDSTGRALQLNDVRNQTYRFEYAGFTEPTLVVHPDGSQRRSVQDSLGRIQSFTDENGNQVSFTQDAAGRVQEIVAPDGTRSLMEYDRERLIRSIDALGRSTRYEYDEKGRLTGVFKTATSSNARSAVMAEAERPEVRLLAQLYSPNDYLTTKTDALGRTTQYFYHPDGNLRDVIDPLGRRTTFSYDEAKNLVAINYPGNRVESITYDALNRSATVTDADGNLWRSEYDELGYITRQIDPRGAETRFEYTFSQLTKITNALGQIVEYGYDLQGNVTSYRDERGFVTTYDYDPRNRLIAQTDPQGNRQQWIYDDFGSVIEYIDARGVSATNEYDDMHRLVRTVSPTGGQSLFEYDDVGNLVQITDPLGRVTRREFDQRDRLIRAIDARDGVISYTYDEVDNLLSLTDPVGNQTQWQYDALDRVIQTTDPLGAISTVAYDVAGNIQQIRDRLGRTRNFTYDRLDRLTREIWNDASGTVVDTHTFTYDRTGNMLTAQDGDSRLTFTYDLLGQMASADNAATSGVPRVLLSYGYDAAGNRTRVSDNFNVTVDSTYDSRNQLQQRAWTGLGPTGSISARVGMSYNQLGQLTEIARFSSLSAAVPNSRATLGYDTANRLTQIRNTSAADAVLANYDMAWDLADQLTEWNINGLSQKYTYDATGQVTAVERGGNANAELYQYDLNGNRQGTGRTVGGNNRLLADATFTYQYDAEGNRISQTEKATGRVTTFAYDHENRLVSANTRSPAGSLLSHVRYRYDALGRRIARVTDADGSGPAGVAVEYYVYDGDDVWLDANGAGAITARYLHGDGIDFKLARYRAEEGLTWYLTDHLGSIRGLLDNAGNVLVQVDYDSFGNIIATVGTATALDRFLYTGREFDSIINQYHYRTRQYDPRAGIFTTEDTIGFLGGDANLARYVGNSPTIYRDPHGLMAVGEAAKSMELQRANLAVAGAKIGFVLGFICGFLETWYLNENEVSSTRFARATLNATMSAAQGAAIGSGVGYLAANPATSYFRIVFGATAALLAVTSSPTEAVMKVRTLCAVIPAAIGIVRSGVIRSRPPGSSISSVGKNQNADSRVARVAGEVQGAVDQAIRILSVGGTGGTRWGKAYQSVKGTGAPEEARWYGNAVQQIAESLLKNNIYLQELGVIFNKGHLLEFRNENGNLYRPDFQGLLPGGKFFGLDITTTRSAPKIFKYDDPENPGSDMILINVVY